MKKILFAINHKKTEEMIENKISDQYLVVGATTYKEAVLDKLESSGADTLLIRDTLPGSLPIDHLLNRVRVLFPEVRIIIICQERPKRDPFLKSMVDLGIYDIINLDRVSVDMIISYILSPRTYRDVAQYGVGLIDDNTIQLPTTDTQQNKHTKEDDKDNTERKKTPGGNFLNGIKELIKPSKPAQSSSSEDNQSTDTLAIPQVNIHLIQESMREAESRKAQANLDTMIQEAVAKQTEDLSAQIKTLKQTVLEKDALLATANQDLIKATARVDDMRAERDKIQLSYSKLVDSTKEGYAIYEKQIMDLRSEVNTPAWYQEQREQWTQKEAELQRALSEKIAESESRQEEIGDLNREIETLHKQEKALQDKLRQGPQIKLVQGEASKKREQELTAQIKELKAALEISESNNPDYSDPDVSVPMLPDNIPFTKSSSPVKTSVFIGGKHGVGTTTVALNVATGLAMSGNNVLLIEINKKFPLLNHYFELTHIPYGIEETFIALSNGDSSGIEKSVIRMRGITSKQKNLAQAYRKLPVGLNLMLFSNNSLIDQNSLISLVVNPITLSTFIHSLTLSGKYSHVIFDIQCDEQDILNGILNNGNDIDSLNLVLSQDSHSIASTGRLITCIAKSDNPNVLAGCNVFITRFNKNISITQGKIEKMLHISSTQVITLSEDSAGYFEAASSATPYIMNGRFKHEINQCLSRYSS